MPARSRSKNPKKPVSDQAAPAPSASRKKVWMTLFQEIDSDRTNSITSANLTHAMNLAFPELSLSYNDIDLMMKEADSDVNGVIDIDEFVSILTKSYGGDDIWAKIGYDGLDRIKRNIEQPVELNIKDQSPHGTHPYIQTIDPNSTQIYYKAKFAETFHFTSPPPSETRKYFHVLENGIEYNKATNGASCCFGACCTQPYTDHSEKSFFDSGIYNSRHYYCYPQGPQTIVSTTTKHRVCCCDGSDTYNRYADYGPFGMLFFPFHCCCACCPQQPEGIALLPMESTGCCCFVNPTRADWRYNLCGACGPADGEPLPRYKTNIVTGLAEGEGARLAHHINSARAEWAYRTGYTDDAK